MLSSSASPRSKTGTHAPGTPALPTPRTATGNPANLNANASYPGSYQQPDGYTQPVASIRSPAATSTPSSARLRATPRPALEQRDSVLRASIFDTALELGVGTSSAVNRWMFGAIGEVDEEVEETIVSPSLTYASTATSDESWLHSSTSSSSQQSTGQRPGVVIAGSARTVQFAPLRQSVIDEREASFDSSIAQAPFDAHPPNSLHKGNKLRKARPHDGYTSDDGYISEGVTPSKSKTKKLSKKEKGEEREGGYLSDVLSRRKRNKDKKGKGKPDALNLETDADGEETDGGYLSSGVASFVRSRKSSASKPKKGSSKSKSNDPDTLFSPQSGAEESDGGYLSSSSVSKKRRFFRLKRGDSEDVPRSSKEVIPPVPALPLSALSTPSPVDGPSRSITPLPIAERFASRSNTPLPRSETATPSSGPSLHVPGESLEYSRSTTPVSVMTARASGLSENDRPVDSGRLIPPALASPNPSMVSLDSPRLTRAFRDAESVRSPSIDVLRAFGRQAGLNMRDDGVKTYLAGGGRALNRVRDDKSSLASTSYGSLRTAAESIAPPDDRDEPTSNDVEVSVSSGQDEASSMPTFNLPSSSVKMKRTFSKKQTPAPLTGLGPSTSDKGMGRRDIRSYEVLKVNNGGTVPTAVNGNDSSADERDSDDRDLMVDVIPATPESGRSRASGPVVPPSPTRRRSPSPTLPLSPARPTALAKYDLPPPSPPPSGPLPRPPQTVMSPSPLIPSSSLPISPTKSSLTADSQAGYGMTVGWTPSSPLGKSSFTQEGIETPVPVPTPSPTRPSFLSRKVSKRPGTAPSSSDPVAPGPASIPPTGYLQTLSQQISPSTPPSAGNSFSRAFGFGRKLPVRPDTAPSVTIPTAPPTSFNTLHTASESSSVSLKRVSSTSSITSLSVIQRGRESPFPSKPVLPPGQRSRAASPIQLTVDRQNVNSEQPASAGAILQRTTSRNADRKYSPVQTLDVHWQPRSASALDIRAPVAGRSTSPSFAQNTERPRDGFDDRSSWVDFDDSPPSSPDGRTDYVRDSKFTSGSKQGDARRSYESQESKPDIDSVLETLSGGDEPLQYGRDSQYSHAEDQADYPDDEDDDDPRERETAYYTSVSAFGSDADDIPPEPVPSRPKNLTVSTSRFAGRYSTSPSPSPTEFDDEMDELEYRKSRASIMDPKRSERVRQKLMQRVEQMRRDGE